VTLTQADRHERQLKRWNITEEMWQAVLEVQHHRCAACGKPFSSNRLPCLDHDHETGLWRGIACTSCNYAIGERHDNVKWFKSVASYLSNPPAAFLQHFVPGSIGEHRARQG
jgi:DNA-directed RNA polymerase subunit RPC12/RpoP